MSRLLFFACLIALAVAMRHGTRTHNGTRHGGHHGTRHGGHHGTRHESHHGTRHESHHGTRHGTHDNTVNRQTGGTRLKTRMTRTPEAPQTPPPPPPPPHPPAGPGPVPPPQSPPPPPPSPPPPPAGPGPAPGRPGREPEPPLPVPEGFSACEQQREVFPHITCDPDGNFTEVQCQGRRRQRMCFCVDRLTGERLNQETFSGGERTLRNINCTQAQRCPEQRCTTVCTNGYLTDGDGCQTCSCQAPPVVETCPTISDLVPSECSCACVEFAERTPRSRRRSRMGRGCPQCRQPCNLTAEEATENPLGDECPMEPSSCSANETLQAVGPHGVNRCVRPLSPDSLCEVQMVSMRSRGRPAPVGASEREIVGEVGGAATPCAEGFVCRQVGLQERRCEPEDPMAPCVRRRQDPRDPEHDPNVECDEDGSFRPVQCRPAPQETMRSPAQEQMCRCVHPANGSSINNTEVRVGPGERRPECNEEAYRHCDVPGIHRCRRQFHVNHGELYFDAENCRTCECRDGNATAFCSDTGNCTVIRPQPQPANCSLPGGELLPHGETRELACGVCGCRDGRLRCTYPPHCREEEEEEEEEDSEEEDSEEEEEEEEGPCQMCRNVPPGPVCGPDQRNHLSRCAAIHCSGISPVDLENGPCQSRDVCIDFPCEDEEDVCVPRGSVACISRQGCRPNQLRTCVDPDDIRCPTNETEDDEDEEGEDASVCGSDNTTYPSVCNLLQRTSNVRVVHAGRCNRPECQSGRVCGTDGVTYVNICAMRSQSTARLDYIGNCDNDNGTVEESCERVRDSGRCLHDGTNCRRLVFPQDGCCPVCGGSVTIAIDRDALQEASQSDPAVATLDGFVSRMTESFVFQDVTERCTLESTLTDTGNVVIVLQPRESNDSEFCHNKTESVALAVNDISSVLETLGEDAPTIVIPQVFEFAVAASTAPLIVELSEIVDTGDGGSGDGGSGDGGSGDGESGDGDGDGDGACGLHVSYLVTVATIVLVFVVFL